MHRILPAFLAFLSSSVAITPSFGGAMIAARGPALPAPMALALQMSTAPPPQAPKAPSAAPAAAPTAGTTGTFNQGQLEQVVAPVALYPDALLSQILMASTYPLQVVEADRWVKANPNVAGDAAAKALEAQAWDPSVKSLVNFPTVLDMMSSQLSWTQQLGDAFVTEQKATMDAIQSLRAKAKAQGNLQSTDQQTVTVEPSSQTIVIQPSNPDVIYVPTYDPTVVYGGWAYPAYPPYYWYPPGYTAGAAAISFGVGVACGLAWGYAWGHCDWNRGDINVNVNQNRQFNQNINRQNYINNYQNNSNRSVSGSRSDWQRGEGTWKHDPANRGGVPYRSGDAAQRFGGYTQQQAEQARQDFRGRADQGRQSLNQGAASEFRGRDAPSGSFGGDRAAGGDRGTARPLPADRSRGDSGAFGGMDRGGDASRSASDRGAYSRGSGNFSQNRGGGNFSQNRGGGSYGASQNRGSGGYRGGYSGGGRSGGGGGRGGSRGGGGRR